MMVVQSVLITLEIRRRGASAQGAIDFIEPQDPPPQPAPTGTGLVASAPRTRSANRAVFGSLVAATCLRA